MSVDSRFDVRMKQVFNDRKARTYLNKFGRNSAVGTTFVPLSNGGLWPMPTAANATKLRIKAGNANDTAGGSGARAVIIQGRDATGSLTTETLTTAGTSAGPLSENSYMRVHRAWISESGTYATTGPDTGSQAADVVIENAAGTEDWVNIEGGSYKAGQSEIGGYTIPKGFDGFIYSIHIVADTNKSADIAFFSAPKHFGLSSTVFSCQARHNLHGGVNRF